MKPLAQLRQGAGQVRTPWRPPRGGSAGRDGRRLSVADNVDGSSGAREAPELGPWWVWRRRAETSGSWFLPPPQGQGGTPQGPGPGCPFSAPRPGCGLFWQVRTPLRAGGSVAPWLWVSAEESP